MITMVGASMAKYAGIKGGGQSVNDMMARLPNSVQAIFGISGFDISEISGYYGMLFMYIAIIATVHAVLLGSDIISKEERDKTSEFLFVKPISRARVVTKKLMAGLINVIALNIVTLVSSLYFVDFFSENSLPIDNITLLMVALLFLQLLFFFVGTVIAAVVKKPKKSATMAASILLFCYILSFLININQNLDGLKYLTPFKYFDAKAIIADNTLDLVYIGLSIVLIGAMIAITYITFRRRDLNI